MELDVIAVGAHPDDCEIGCGGTLAKLVADGYRVGIIDLTNGEPTPLCDSPEIRLAEAKAAAECLGVVHRVTLDLPNRKLFDSVEARILLAREFRRYKPKLVIGMVGKTPTASPDHWQAMQIVDGAIFYSRLSKWEHYFDGAPVYSIPYQAFYSLNLAPDYIEPGMYPLVSDISQTLDAKLNSVRCYATQFPSSKENVFQRLELLARTLGFAAGFSAGEKLFVPKMVGTRNLMETLKSNPLPVTGAQ